MKTTHQVRKSFEQYFVQNGHMALQSSSLLPNDPTLLFTNAGMVQFKNCFLDVDQAQYRNVTTCQKVLRVSGKHNDFDNVGKTYRHHTFFEMLGNFSFADYFKEQAIVYAYDFLTKELAINPADLMFTVFLDDDESHNLWKKIAGHNAIVERRGYEDNFWQMDRVGLCGPCTEIYIRNGSYASYQSNQYNNDEYTEIWNLVFMQYDRQENGDLVPLLNPCVDTGMGLERIAALLQGTYDNYHTDTLRLIMDQYFADNLPGQSFYPEHVAARVVADHTRAACMLIDDGVVPSNEGHGYVLRRIIRRAMRYGYLDNIQNPFMYRLVPTVVEIMQAQYPTLLKNTDAIKQVIEIEEEAFLRTISSGMKILEKELSSMDQKATYEAQLFSGGSAFKLYDTFGFPLDLIEVILEERGHKLDQEGFVALLQEQKERSKWKKSDTIDAKSLQKVIIDQNYSCDFISRATDAITTEILWSMPLQDNYWALIMAQTPFYATSGGQKCDTGWISAKDGKKHKIIEVYYADKGSHQSNIVHIVEILDHVPDGYFATGESVVLQINQAERWLTMIQHTSIHILQAALRHVLGTHVMQQGSYVDAHKFRFDFNHHKVISLEELQLVNEFCNQAIYACHPVQIQYMDYLQAINHGALAFAEDKYNQHQQVRVVSIGQNLSVELCGGTHAANTSEIGSMAILSCSSIASGIKRIEGVSGYNVGLLQQKQQALLQQIASSLKCNISEVVVKCQNLHQQSKMAKGNNGNSSAYTHKYQAGKWAILIYNQGNMEQLRSQIPYNTVVLNIGDTDSKFAIMAKSETELNWQDIFSQIGIKGQAMGCFLQGGGLGNVQEIAHKLQNLLS